MGNDAGNIIQILAGLPDFLRKPILQNRLNEFYSMSEADRRETIGMALSGAPTISPDKLAVLFKTWLEVLSEFEPQKRAMMLMTYCSQIFASPHQIEKLDFKLLTATFLSLDQKQRELLKDSLHEVLLSIPYPGKITKAFPEETLRAAGLK